MKRIYIVGWAILGFALMVYSAGQQHTAEKPLTVNVVTPFQVVGGKWPFVDVNGQPILNAQGVRVWYCDQYGSFPIYVQGGVPPYQGLTIHWCDRDCSDPLAQTILPPTGLQLVVAADNASAMLQGIVPCSSLTTSQSFTTIAGGFSIQRPVR